VAKRNDHYTLTRRRGGNLAHASDDGLLDAFAAILAAARTVLRPGGIVVVTARPWGHNGVLVVFPGAVATAAERAGITCWKATLRCLPGCAGDQLVSRASFFQLHQVRTARARGIPLRVIAHEDVLVFQSTNEPRQRRPRA
jgi:modification methylase